MPDPEFVVGEDQGLTTRVSGKFLFDLLVFEGAFGLKSFLINCQQVADQVSCRSDLHQVLDRIWTQRLLSCA